MSCRVLYHLEVIFAQWEDQLKENYSSLGLKKEKERESNESTLLDFEQCF